MPITMFAKQSPERSRPGWQTTRFWLSCWAMSVATGAGVWGAVHAQAGAVGAGAGSAAVIAAVYVWAISREA